MIALSRRELLAGAAAAGVLASATLPLREPTSGFFAYDRHLDTAGIALAVAVRAHRTIIRLPEDFGDWVHRLDSQQDWHGIAFTGLTTPGVAFIFEQLALRRGRRFVHHDRYFWSLQDAAHIAFDR